MNLTLSKEYLERLVNIHTEKLTLDEDLKSLKEEIEEKIPELNFTSLNKIASLKAKQKLGDTVSKMEEFKDLVDALNG